MSHKDSTKIKKLIWNEFYKKYPHFLGTLIYYVKIRYNIDAEKAYLTNFQLFKQLVKKIYGELGWQLFLEEVIDIAQQLNINIEEIKELANT